jgi:hypothetical protein
VRAHRRKIHKAGELLVYLDPGHAVPAWLEAAVDAFRLMPERWSVRCEVQGAPVVPGIVAGVQQQLEGRRVWVIQWLQHGHFRPNLFAKLAHATGRA